MDRAVARLKARSVGAYKAPKVRYICTRKACHFSADNLVDSWLHSLRHGPWPEMGSLAEGYVLMSSALARTNGVAHPRGESLRN